MYTQYSELEEKGKDYLEGCKMDTGSFLGVKSGWVVTLTTHPLLVPWSRNSRAIPLLPLWPVRPVLSLSVCTRVHVTFTITLKALSKSNIIKMFLMDDRCDWYHPVRGIIQWFY